MAIQKKAFADRTVFTADLDAGETVIFKFGKNVSWHTGISWYAKPAASGELTVTASIDGGTVFFAHSTSPTVTAPESTVELEIAPLTNLKIVSTHAAKVILFSDGVINADIS